MKNAFEFEMSCRRVFFRQQLRTINDSKAIAIFINKKFQRLSMPTKKKPGMPSEIPAPHKQPDISEPTDPEEPIIPKEDPDIIPDEEPFETPPYEIPQPGEGP